VSHREAESKKRGASNSVFYLWDGEGKEVLVDLCGPREGRGMTSKTRNFDNEEFGRQNGSMETKNSLETRWGKKGLGQPLKKKKTTGPRCRFLKQKGIIVLGKTRGEAGDMGAGAYRKHTWLWEGKEEVMNFNHGSSLPSPGKRKLSSGERGSIMLKRDQKKGWEKKDSHLISFGREIQSGRSRSGKKGSATERKDRSGKRYLNRACSRTNDYLVSGGPSKKKKKENVSRRKGKKKVS